MAEERRLGWMKGQQKKAKPEIRERNGEDGRSEVGKSTGMGIGCGKGTRKGDWVGCRDSRRSLDPR